MDSFKAIITAWGGISPIAKDMGVTYLTAQKWFQRDSIPPKYWIPLCEAARRRRLDGVTPESLSRLTMKPEAA